MSMELISREAVLELIEHSNIYPVNLMLNIVSDMPTVKAIPIERLEQIRAEIKEGLYGPEEMSETDSERAEAFNNGLNYCIEIIDKAIKEVGQ